MIFSTYPSILLYQSFGKWKRMSNLPPAIFIGPLKAEKRFFGSKSEKITFPTNSHRAPFGLPVPSDGNKCCVCCLKKQHMLPKNFRSCKGCSQLSVDIFMASGDLLVAQKSYFLQKSLEKNHNTLTPPLWLADAVIYLQILHFESLWSSKDALDRLECVDILST